MIPFPWFPPLVALLALASFVWLADCGWREWLRGDRTGSVLLLAQALVCLAASYVWAHVWMAELAARR